MLVLGQWLILGSGACAGAPEPALRRLDPPVTANALVLIHMVRLDSLGRAAEDAALAVALQGLAAEARLRPELRWLLGLRGGRWARQ